MKVYQNLSRITRLVIYLFLFFFLINTGKIYPNSNMHCGTVNPSAKGSLKENSKREIANAVYSVELLPGQSFAGYIYYWDSGTSKKTRFSEQPDVDWLDVSPRDFTTQGSADPVAVQYQFTAPTIPGTYSTVIIDNEGNWSDREIIVNVTETPTADTMFISIYAGKEKESTSTYEWKGFNVSHWSSSFTGPNPYAPDSKQEISISKFPSGDWLLIEPDTFTLVLNQRQSVKKTVRHSTPGTYVTYEAVQSQWASLPAFTCWILEVKNTPGYIPNIRVEPDTAGWVLFDKRIDSGFDTLFHLMTGLPVLAGESKQTRIEATRIELPDIQYLDQYGMFVENLMVKFRGGGNKNETKKCKFFVWEDANGQPGAVSATFTTTVSITNESQDDQFFTPYFLGGPAYLGRGARSFWIGHEELSPGYPTSVGELNLSGSPDHLYSEDGINWHISDLQCHQQVQVVYQSDFKEIIVRNTGKAPLKINRYYMENSLYNPYWWENNQKDTTQTMVIASGDTGFLRLEPIWEIVYTYQPGDLDFLHILSDDPDTPDKIIPVVFKPYDNTFVTNIENYEQNEKPNDFSFISNYPNPFNPETTIQFGVNQSGPVKLQIFNATGQLIRTLMNASLSCGNHSVQWQARDDAGNPVASGIYFVRLTVQKTIWNHKLLYLK